MKRILVTGSREWKDSLVIEKALEEFAGKDVVIVHGNARGADMIAGITAHSMGLHTAAVDPLWNKFGKRAGPIRNEVMIRLLEPDLILAFPLPGSTGTKHAIRYASGFDIPMREYWGEE